MEVAIAALILLLTILYILYRQKTDEPPSRSRAQSRRAYQRGGGSAISVSSISTDAASSVSVLNPVASTDRTAIKSGTDYGDNSNVSDSSKGGSLSSSRASSTETISPADPEDKDALRRVCDCGNIGLTAEERDNLPAPEDLVYRTNNPTNVFPINFNSYTPIELVHTIETPTAVCPAALAKSNPAKVTVVTAFQPALHAVYFAHHYALLIQELVDNYNYL